MSFDTLKVGELKTIAEDFGVETSQLKNKQDIIAALSEEGVTYSVYEKTKKAVEDAKEEVEVLPVFDPKSISAEDTVLVKMDRQNYRYDILSQTFTKEHPFVAVSKEIAQKIFDQEEGFRLATPKEVQDYYS
jgi:UDP-N-acetyl-D-mannosaminuronate dehydrogenase